jgi:metal-responsive CopG/Arc/MetJ family transcriptional regulator
MVKTIKLNFTIPEDIARELKNRIGKNKRSAFVTEAVRSTLEELKKKQLKQELEEGYRARQDENSEINKEWEKITLENWD